MEDKKTNQEIPNIPVGGTPREVTWAVTARIYLVGTEEPSMDGGLDVTVNEDGRIMWVNYAHSNKQPVYISDDTIFEILDDYPLNPETGGVDRSIPYPLVIRRNGSETHLPESDNNEEDMKSEPPTEEIEEGKAPQPIDPDDQKQSDEDPDSIDESKPDDNEG